MRPQIMMATIGAVIAILVSRRMGADNLEAFGAMIAGLLAGLLLHWLLERGKS